MIRRTALTAFLLLVISTLSINAADPAKSEVDGSWKLISFNENGKDSETTVKEEFVIVRKDGVQTISKGGAEISKSRFTVDIKAIPKTITFTGIENNETSTTGIYTINEGTMKIAVLSDKKKSTKMRPNDFEVGTDKTIATYRKSK